MRTPRFTTVCWSPVIHLGFITIPLCAGLLGGYLQAPLLAIALCVPQSGYIGWFYRQSGALLIGMLTAMAWWLPQLSGLSASGQYDLSASLIGPMIITLFALLNGRLRTSVDLAQLWSETDPLTGLLNRRGFDRRLAVEVNRSKRLRRPLSVAYIDCDDFKKFNDSRGHQAGDRLLCELAELLQSSVRNCDAVSRLGGDEFAILIVDADSQGTTAVLKRLESRLQELVAINNWPISWSVGATVFLEPQEASSMLEAADSLMYEAKRSGKGRTLLRELSSSAAKPLLS